MLYPPEFDESVPITVRNTYLLSWVIVLVVVPMLIVFALAAPQMTSLIIPMDAALAGIAIFQIAMVRSGRSTSTGPALAILGWAMLTWAAWQTGGMHSPALYGQFVLVVLAEMCNGWRWGMVSLGLSTLTLAMFTWAEVVRNRGAYLHRDVTYVVRLDRRGAPHHVRTTRRRPRRTDAGDALGCE